MLTTLLKIGEWQSHGKSEWDRFLDYPRPDTTDRHGNRIKNYSLSIVFDLDNQDVVIDRKNLIEYDEDKIIQYYPLKIKGGNNKAIYTSAPAKKITQIYKTFFGKEDNNNAETGELEEAILKFDSKLLSEDFKSLLDHIFLLKESFLEQTISENKSEVDIKTIENLFELNRDEKLIFLVVYIKGDEFGYETPTPFSKIPAYIAFIEQSYFGKMEKPMPENKEVTKLCYASGENTKNVSELSLDNRYSLNKMFVTETRNYASVFDKNKFGLNYQVSAENQEYLDYASNYLLNQGYKVRIANLDHVIIPQFLQNSNINLEMALEGIQRKSDLLFNLKKLDTFNKNIQDWLDKEDEVFWINFIAFESDGNFFKSTEIIKDVSRFHIDKLLMSFHEINNKFQQANFVNWNTVMTDYGEPRNINFNSLYQIIPLRKDKEKKNKALDLFKTILENRKVDSDILYEYFTELILCHHYSRYSSYTNVKNYGKDFFYFAVRDSVFKYLAFLELLKTLNLIDMEDINTITENINQYDQLENEFFEKMKFNQEQRAMFFLGRMLNSVEYLQQGKNKTVIQKVNFNGMDKDSIQRLRIDLIEKAKQYNSMNKIVFTDQKFGNEFDFNNWKLSPQEAIFFMLTGYSFGAGKKNENNTIDE
ncbi:TM1802 family CRISPR-associated protein [Gelidibacter japonicus]|uniref:TM1802 family CRISPR-associated protein n=1 Tax=Gelidibacter japonicus TaxID=1962232 RepID=UPI0013D0A189|nr:TM1802 family CRISPR-associated protein [Gelidibacter japonicus]